MIPAFTTSFVSDRRCWLLLLTALLALVLSFVAIPDSIAIGLVSKFGFWFVLATFLIWVSALWGTFAPSRRIESWRSWDWATILIVAASGTILLSHEKFGFKIVMDELMLLGTSMSMHLDKSVLTPLRGNDIQGAFVVLEGIVDKRPLFFPFLVSLLHDLFGYRPANAFALNAVLTFIYLSLVFATGRMLAGRVAGWLGVVLFAGLPLLGHNSTGGGFELLNLTMIVATILLGARWVEKRDAPSLTAFCFAGLLLAQVRYESVIFLLPVILLVLFVWLQERRPILTWPIIFAPLLMVHYPLQHRIFDLRESAWELFSKPGYSEPFAVKYIPENLEHALKFFFGPASDQPNSIVLSVYGLIALPFFLLLVVKRIRSLRSEPSPSVAVMIFSLGFVLQFLLLMCYFWGKFDEVIIRRLSLPTHLAMVIALLAVLPQFRKPVVLRTLLAIACVGLLVRSIPSMAAHAYSQEYLPAREVAWRREFMAAQPRPDYLMIDNDSTLWITHRVSATPTVVAVKRREDIAFHMRNRTFSDVFVFQRLNIDPETNQQKLRDGDDLGPNFELATVVEERLQVLTVSRISRVKQITSGALPISTREPVKHAPSKSRAEIEQARRQFLESYMKQLP
jgi:hypothetical protein